MSADIDEKITSIGQAFGLNIEQLGELSLLTHMITLGYINPENFETELEKFKLPNEKTKEIAEEINNKILKTIREKLKLAQINKNDEKNNIPNIDITEQTKKDSEILKNEEIERYGNEKEDQNKKIIESISFKKLSESFKSPTIKTEYTSNNQEKGATSATQHDKIPLEATLKPASSEAKATSPSYSIKEDPYRMKPE